MTDASPLQAPVAAEVVHSIPAVQRRFWSVTTLIGSGTATGQGLMTWIARTVAEAGVDKRDVVEAMLTSGDRNGAVKYLMDSRWVASEKAAARGSMLHEVAKSLALGVPLPPFEEHVKPYVEQFIRYLDDHQPEYLLSEAPVYNLDYSYAGTLDAVVRVGGATVIKDVKTNYKGPEDRNRPPYPEIALQLVAYAHAQLVGLRQAAEREEEKGKRYYLYDDTLPTEPMPEVEGALALIVTPYDYILKPVRIDDEVWTAWLYVRESARWALETSKRVLGPEIYPPKREVE